MSTAIQYVIIISYNALNVFQLMYLHILLIEQLFALVLV